MRKVILDTNFLLLPYQFRLDVFSEIERALDEPKELLVPSVVLEELRRLAARRNRAAKLGLAMLEQKMKEGKVQAVKSSGKADDWIAGNAEKLDAVVCTNDIGLRKRLLRKAKMLVLRNRSHLELV
jgi:rRNA-processing protein FCF1